MTTIVAHNEGGFCRTCANFFVPSTEVDFVDLFQPIEGLQEQIHFLLEELRSWQLNVSPNDGLPQVVCSDCFTKFCGIATFRQECEQANRRLLESFGLQNSVTDATLISQNVLPANGFVEVDAMQGEVTIGMNAPQDVDLNGQQELGAYAIYDTNLANFSPTTLLNEAANSLVEQKNDVMEYIPPLEDPNLYYTDQTVYAKEAANIVESAVMNTEMPTIASQDLEDMLQGCIIPTRPTKVPDDEPTVTATVNLSAEANGYAVENGEVDATITSTTSTDFGSSSKIFTCQYCYSLSENAIEHLTFRTPDELSQHLLEEHDPNQPYSCPYCTETWRSSRTRAYHVRVAHDTILQEICEFCNKAICTTKEVHQYTCAFINDWECDRCTATFPDTPRYRFLAHQRTHENATKQYNCRVCKRVFVRRANLEAHERLHDVKASVLIACDECDATFCGDYELRRHKYQAHDGELPVTCEYCPKGFVSLAFLSRHMHNFHAEKLDENDTDASTCPDCGTKFDSKLKLRFHMQRPRDENGRCLDNPENFREKRRQQRQGIFACPECPRHFHMKTQLERHVRTHDAVVRRFQCQQCEVRCRNSYELQQHVNVAHLNLRNFKCDICDKEFGFKKHLREHKLFHAELSVRCPENNCDYICKNEKALSTHINHKHFLHHCEYCGEFFSRQRLTIHLRTVHRAEIDVEMTEGQQYLLNGVAPTDDDKVRVEILNGESMQSVALQEQPVNGLSPLPDQQLDNYFLSSAFEPDHEIIVT